MAASVQILELPEEPPARTRVPTDDSGQALGVYSEAAGTNTGSESSPRTRLLNWATSVSRIL